MNLVCLIISIFAGYHLQKKFLNKLQYLVIMF